jgi:methylated-DNA-protein-cysteine methyltransferase-like protein
MKRLDRNFFQRVYQLVRRIPAGKVATYGNVARALETKDARRVGWALHANRNPWVPCHRVVNKEGRVAENFAFGGWREQKRRLREEGVEFKDERQVNLEKCLARDFS